MVSHFLQKDSLRLVNSPIKAYKEARKLEVILEEQVAGNQLRNPENAAAVLIKMAESASCPLHLFLGTDACNRVNSKIETLQEQLTTNESLTKSTDYNSSYYGLVRTSFCALYPPLLLNFA